MRTAVMLIVLGLALGACKKGGGMVADIEAWGNAACECKDKACAEKQGEEFNKLEKKYESELDKMNEETEKKLESILEKANGCLSKFEVEAG
ncbi:MAG: hypothetical protein HY907_04575 [Deltaproteobacteria bacterium]|nr:hypothetical protein [Deltaproteobacteria bacterium]